MHVLILTQTFPLTPKDKTAHFMYDFAHGFTQLGHHVTVVVPFHEKLRPGLFRPIRVLPFRYIWPDSLHVLGFDRTLRNDQTIPWSTYLLSPFYIVCGILALLSAVRKGRVDIINAHWIVPNGFLAAIVSLLTGIPVVVTLPGSDVYLARKNFFGRIMAWVALRVSLRVTSNSPQLLKDLGVRGPVISYPVPTNRGKREKCTALRVATAGRRVEKKGFAIAEAVYPAIEIISGLPIDAFRKKLLSVDIFIAYSIRDRAGNLDDASLTVLEAMAAGCAVITTDTPGYSRIIRHGVDGFLVRNPQQLSKLLTRLRRSPDLVRRVGAHARRTIAATLTPVHVARSYVRLFSTEAISKNSSLPGHTDIR